MIKDITEESEVWITNDNLNQRINTNLFAGRRATTGLVTKSSEHWKYYCNAFEFEGNPAMRGAGLGEADDYSSSFARDTAEPADKSVNYKMCLAYASRVILY